MFYQDDVINFCKSEFAFLNFEHGSSRPIVKRRAGLQNYITVR